MERDGSGIADPPSVVLMCHEDDPVDAEGLASWLASTFRLAGLVLVRDTPARRWRAARRELRRSGVAGLLDVLALRACAWLTFGRRDAVWTAQAAAALRRRYPADLTAVPRIVVTTPNSDPARDFLQSVRPDLVIARCKVILEPRVLDMPRFGTFVLHPGICPEYRNAHGCFWALARRDLGRVGVTLLRADRGVDTGPIYFQGGCTFDELRESHIVIQYRAVLDNLEPIGRTLLALGRGEEVPPLTTDGRASMAWGQPRLTRYLRWKWAARRNRDARRVAALS